MDVEIVERLARVEDRAKSNTRRIEELAEVGKALQEQGKTLAVMCASLERQGNELVEQGKRLRALEERPQHKWDTLVSSAITALVGMAIGALWVSAGLPG